MAGHSTHIECRSLTSFAALEVTRCERSSLVRMHRRARTYNTEVRAALVIVFLVVGLDGQVKRGLTPADLENFTYDFGDNASVEGGKVPLAGGRWKNPAEGGNSFSLLPHRASGDLDGDGVADVAGIILEALDRHRAASRTCSPR